MLSKLSKQYFTFVKGLITEASPLTFPEGASLDEQNFQLNLDGSRERRLGIDYETDYVKHAVSIVETDAVALYEWVSAREDSTKNYVVTQAGEFIYFYEDVDALSANKQAFSLDLTNYAASGASDANVKATKVSMSSGRGALYIVGKYTEPLQITLNAAFDTLTATILTIYIRDFVGAEESIGNEVQPTTLTDAHKYNLMNQGWATEWLTDFASATSKYPALNMVPWIGIYPDPTTNKFDFAVENLLQNAFGDSRSASGKYIVNAFDTTIPIGGTAGIAIASWVYSAGTITMDTDVAHGLSASDEFTITNNFYEYVSDVGETVGSSLDGTYTVVSAPSGVQITFTKTIPRFSSMHENELYLGNLAAQTDVLNNPSGVSETYRPSVTTFFSGRVWYAGVQSTRLGSTIFFSQIVENEDYAEKCYQSADPTSQYFTEIVDTDGGTIVIGDMDNVLRMEPYGNSLLVFARNGVWQIAAGEGGYFRPSSYGVRKITSVGLVSPMGACFIDGTPVYCAQEGLIALAQDPQTGFLTVQNLTETTVQTLYNDIPKECKPYLAMAYEPNEKRMHMLYASDSTYKYQYDFLLTFDVRLKAFYKYTFPSTNPYVAGFISRYVTAAAEDKVKYFTIETSGVTFSQFNNEDFLDWYINDSVGIDASAYLITGYELGEAAFMSKYASRVHCFFRRTETTFAVGGGYDTPSSCTMQARWEWADHSNSGKFDQSQEVYRFRRFFSGNPGDPINSGYPVVVSNNKIRGRGKSLHLKFSTTAGYDCNLLGWSIVVERDTRV